MKSNSCKYKCLKCDHNWEEYKPRMVECPICGHVYVKWVNFKEWRKENMIYPYT